MIKSLPYNNKYIKELINNECFQDNHLVIQLTKGSEQGGV